MNPTILVPVDFTDVSLNAYRYANQLAFRMGYDLILAHVFSGALNTNEPLIVKAGQSRIEVLRDRLKLYTRWYPNQSEKLKNVKTEFQVLQGDTVDQLLNCAHEYEVKLIVAGTRDKHTKIDKWLGSVSFGLCRQASIPVLFVPKDQVLSAIQQVVVASDYHSNDSSVLEQYLSFNKAYHATTHFVHIDRSKDVGEDDQQAQIAEILDVYSPPDQPFQMVNLVGEDIISELFNYANKIKADLVVFVPERRPVVQALLHHSTTEEALMHNQIPIMLFHSIGD